MSSSVRPISKKTIARILKKARTGNINSIVFKLRTEVYASTPVYCLTQSLAHSLINLLLDEKKMISTRG